MANLIGYVCKYEVTRSAGATSWQFFVGGTAVVSDSHDVFEAMMLAIQTASEVLVVTDDGDNVIRQVQTRFRYVCQQLEYKACSNHPAPQPAKPYCETRRYSPCDDERVHACDNIQ